MGLLRCALLVGCLAAGADGHLRGLFGRKKDVFEDITYNKKYKVQRLLRCAPSASLR